MVADFLGDVGGTYPLQFVSLKCPSYNDDWANDDVDSSATSFNKMVDEITQIIINDYIKDMFD